MIVGIDPAQRNVGLCFRPEGTQPPFFEQIRTESDILSSAQEIRIALRQCLKDFKPTVFALEKQMPNATFTGPLLFYIQMVVLETIVEYDPAPKMIWPLPVQLKSYLIKVEKADVRSKSAIVKHFKERTGIQERLSSHCVEAYYLTELARKVLGGSWGYNVSEAELPITPWKVLNGK